MEMVSAGNLDPAGGVRRGSGPALADQRQRPFTDRPGERRGYHGGPGDGLSADPAGLGGWGHCGVSEGLGAGARAGFCPGRGGTGPANAAVFCVLLQYQPRVYPASWPDRGDRAGGL